MDRPTHINDMLALVPGQSMRTVTSRHLVHTHSVHIPSRPRQLKRLLGTLRRAAPLPLEDVEALALRPAVDSVEGVGRARAEPAQPLLLLLHRGGASLAGSPAPLVGRGRYRGHVGGLRGTAQVALCLALGCRTRRRGRGEVNRRLGRRAALGGRGRLRGVTDTRVRGSTRVSRRRRRRAVGLCGRRHQVAR